MRARVVAGLLMLLAACHDAADKPLEPVWGKQPCDHCAMLLDEPRFAAQLALPDGSHLYFDDIGCLAAWLREHSASRARAWVRRGAQWIDASSARYAGDERTPMGYGYIAAANDVGGAIDWRALQQRLAGGSETHAQ